MSAFIDMKTIDEGAARALPAKGYRFIWVTDGPTVFITVTRAARDGCWADIRCTTVLHRGDDRGTWTKRQPLPLPESFKLVRS
jgi:hypothetical protein